MSAKTKEIISNFKNLFIESLKTDSNTNRIDNDKVKFKANKEQAVSTKKQALSEHNPSSKSKVIDDLENELEWLVLTEDDGESLFGLYTDFYVRILDEMVLEKSVSRFPEYFNRVMLEFIKIPETHVTANNTLDEAYILHSRIVVPKILNYYKKNIENKEIADSLLKLTIHMSHYILLPFPDKFLKNLPVKRPIKESESNLSLTGWQDQAYNDYLNCFQNLKYLGVQDEINIMKSILEELNNKAFDSDPVYSLALVDSENISMDILESDQIGAKIKSSGNFNSILNLFEKMFVKNSEYCMDNFLNEIDELISKTKPRLDLDIKLFHFSQVLIDCYIENEYKNTDALEAALKYSSLISVNSLSCYCQKYRETKYKGIKCDICNVTVESGGLKYGSYEYLLNKLADLKTFKASVSFSTIYTYKKNPINFAEFINDNNIISNFIFYINKIDNKKQRQKLLFSLLKLSQSQQYTIRDKITEYFRICQSENLEEYLSMPTTIYQNWANELIGRDYTRKNYYKSYNNELNKSVDDESVWEDLRTLDSLLFKNNISEEDEVLLKEDVLFDEEEGVDLATIREYENFIYDVSNTYNYNNKYIKSVIVNTFKKFSENGLKTADFNLIIGKFKNDMIEVFKKNNNVKQIDVCIDDFMESITKNGVKEIERFVELVLDLKKSKEIIASIETIKNNYAGWGSSKRIVNYIINNTEIDYVLLLSNLFKNKTSSDFIALNEKFNLMTNDQVFKYMFQFSENITALKYFLNFYTNLKLDTDKS